jgi:hypothetical protein
MRVRLHCAVWLGIWTDIGVSSIAILGISGVFVVRGIHFGHGPYLGLRGSTSGTTTAVVKCIVYIIRFVMAVIKCTVYIMHFAMAVVKRTVYTMHFATAVVKCIVYTMHFATAIIKRTVYPSYCTGEDSSPPTRKSGPCFLDCEIGHSAQKKGEYGI